MSKPPSASHYFWDWKYATDDGSSHCRPPEPPGNIRFVVDVGACYGYCSFQYAEWWPEAEILAIEMEEGNCEIVRETLAPFAERTHVHQAAVGYPPREDGVVYWWNGSGATNIVEPLDGYVINEAFFNPAFATKGKVEIVTLDQALDVAGFGDRVIDFMKMDIEGAEHEVLFDGGAWPLRTRCLWLEGHRHHEILGERLRGLGFKVTMNVQPYGHIWAVR